MDALAGSGLSEHGAWYGITGGANRGGAARARGGLPGGVSSRPDNRLRGRRSRISAIDRESVRRDRAGTNCVHQYGWTAHDAGSQSGGAAALPGRSDAGGRRRASAGRPLSHVYATADEALFGLERSHQEGRREAADLSMHGERERASAGDRKSVV